MKAFAILRQEERIGIFKREVPRELRIGNDVAVAQLGKNDFQ